MPRIDSDKLEEIKARLAERVDDFVEYAHPIIAVKEWEYYDGKPDRDRVRSLCHELIGDLQPGTSSDRSTGRIRVWYQIYPHKTVGFGIDLHRPTDSGHIQV